MAFNKEDMTHANVKDFDLGKGREACLLIHGFTGTPAQFRPMGEFLANEGYRAVGICLPGHAKTIQEMEATTWRQWLLHAEDTAKRLRAEHEKLYIGGLSMGGAISLILASKGYADAVISYSTPIRIYAKGADFARIIWPFYRYRKWAPIIKPDFLEEYSQGYAASPTRKVYDLMRLIHMAERGLPKVHCPALVIQSKNDETVRPISADIIFSKLASPKKELVMLEHSPHELTIGLDREQIFSRTVSFLKGI